LLREILCKSKIIDIFCDAKVELSTAVAEYIGQFCLQKRRHSLPDLLMPTEYKNLRAHIPQLSGADPKKRGTVVAKNCFEDSVLPRCLTEK
jgi:hypothetical protein